MPRIEVDNSDIRLAAQAGGPIEIIDRATGQAFYLISSEQYQKLCAVLSGDFDPRAAYPLVDLLMAADDADDPLLDSYQ